jgi:hypothetical protein
MNRPASSKVVAFVTVALVTTACAHTHRHAPDTGSYLSRVFVDGKPVTAGATQSLLDLLRLTLSATRLGDERPLELQPFVLVDGVAFVTGVRALADLPATHVDSVVVLRPAQAMGRYGARARWGAVVVRTRR